MTSEEVPERRQFFREVARRAIQTSGAALGGIDSLRGAAYEGLVAARDFGTGSEIEPPAPAWDRRPFYGSGGGLLVLDRRAFPALSWQRLSTAQDLAGSVRRHHIVGGPWMLPLSLEALAGTVRSTPHLTPREQRTAVRATAGLLAGLDPDSPWFARAKQMVGDFDAGADEADFAHLLSTAAKEEISEIELAQRGQAERLRRYLGEHVTDKSVLVFGHATNATGGVTIDAVQRALPRNRLFIAEGRPAAVGRSVTIPAAAAAGLSATLIADASFGSLVYSDQVGAVVIGADLIDGPTAIGGPGMIAASATAAACGVPVVVVGMAGQDAVSSPPERPKWIGPDELPHSPPAWERMPTSLADSVITGD